MVLDFEAVVEVFPTEKRRLKERGATSRIVHISEIRENFQLRRRVLEFGVV